MSIGQDIPRVDGPAKLAGRAIYVDDQVLPGVLHAAVVRTPIARGRVRRVQFDPSINWAEFTIVDHRDIRGANGIAMIERDVPALVADEFRHKHEPVILLAHRSLHKLRAAVRAVHIDAEPLPPVLDPLAPLSAALIQHGTDNVLKKLDIRKGDPAALFATAPHVVEATYRTGSQEHVYLETQGMTAWQEDGRLVVSGSMQCPYYVVDALCACFQRPASAFRVIQAPVGGGFGGKEEYPSVLAIHAALLAEKSGAPVKLILERQEDMAATTKRHPSVVRHRTAVDRDGRLLAMEIEVILDGGAYVTLSPVVLSRACIHAAGPYFCEHIHIHGEARLTNSPPYGAFRGFGAPQSIFAMERHMDAIAARLSIDPVELRRRNLLRDGQTMATGQVFRDGPDLVRLMDSALSHADFHNRRARHAAFNVEHPYLRRGIGLATFHHGSGFTGSGESKLQSEAAVIGRPDGRVEVLTAQTDMGQGTTTVLTQIVADKLAIAESDVIIAQPDTARVPNSGPTVASRTVMVVGGLLEQACDDLLRQLGAPTTALRGADLVEAIRDWRLANPDQELLGRAKYRQPATIQWDEINYRGDAYGAYSWATYVAEVEVDLRTFGVRVVDFVAAQEVGRVINPTLARGQIQGGVAQGIGWALYEDVVLADGAMRNNQMTNYVIPAAADLPPIRVFFDENGSPFGPRGAKGIGELPMDGPAPAILNAVAAAVGVQPCQAPLLPERLMKLLCENVGGGKVGA